MRSNSILGCLGRLRYLPNEDQNESVMNVIFREMWANWLLECVVDLDGSV